MGTLTAGQPRLDHYCEHKLPTSCRLSSIGECCACYDERPHAATYTTYIDGVGLVPRGTRWQRYCWFCKEFWQARVEASGLRPGQTRIPEVPDQTAFLERWYEFHQGYRVITKEDGGEERVAVLGEEMSAVEPGHLPRTLEELREGRERSAAEAALAEQQRQEEVAAREEEPEGPTLEDTLDQLFLSAENEGAASAQPVEQRGTVQQNVHAQAMVAAGSRNREYQARRVAALRRELHRMRNGIERVISGLREFGENVPDAGEATGRLTTLGRTLDDISGVPPSNHDADLAIRSVNELASNTAASQTDQTFAAMQRRVDEARDHVNEARRMRDQAASEFNVAEQEFNTSSRRLQQLQRDQRTAENYSRLFGTREEILAQGDDYESPVGGMFSRAYERFNVAEQVRQEERTLRQVLEEERRTGGEDGQRGLDELESRQRDVWGVRQPPRLAQDLTSNTTNLMEEARDEVFAGQTLAGMVDEGREQEVAELAGDAPPGHNDNGDTPLEEYNTLLRNQGWSQQPSQEPRPPRTNFPSTMLQGVLALRSREQHRRQNVATEETPVTNQQQQQQEEIMQQHRQFRLVQQHTMRQRLYEQATALGMPYQQPQMMDPQQLQQSLAARTTQPISPLEPYSPTAEDRRQDFLHVLAFLATSMDWRETVGLQAEQVNRSLAICNDATTANLVPELSAVLGDMNPSTLLQRDDLVWACGLPAARLVRIRRSGQQVSFSNQPQSNDTEDMRGNMEIMAEVFQMSAELRRRSGLSSQEQLDMLSRLQQGLRREEDRTVFASMLLEDETAQLASTVHREQLQLRETAQRAQETLLNEQRRLAARDGDFSRQGLDAQRRQTSAVATTALSNIMREIGAPAARGGAHRRVLPIPNSWSSESEEEEEDQEQGLDARDSGRPEPKSDEEMTVKLECRICYSQTAEVACLPCGHLVMCKWCSEQHSPTMAHDRTRPRRAAACPVCRKGIRQKVRVFRA
jgi:hypothetical protein